MDKKFWKEWKRFVIMLIGILILWIFLIFIGNKIFKNNFEELRVFHYLLLFILIIKAKKIFLNRIKEDKKNENDTDNNN